WRGWFVRNADARFEAEEVIVSGRRATVLWVYRKMRNGQPWHLRGVDVFTVRDGKVAAQLAYVKGGSSGLVGPVSEMSGFFGHLFCPIRELGVEAPAHLPQRSFSVHDPVLRNCRTSEALHKLPRQDHWK